MDQELPLTLPENKSSTSKRRSHGSENVIVGSEDFNKIRESSAFVDKTMLIKDFVDSSDEVLLITCPRRFGKSSNMDMIKNFLQMKVDDSGKQIRDLPNNENYKIFNEEINNKRLKIMDDVDFVLDHFANHPVIFVNFKGTQYGETFESVENGIKTEISHAFKEHNYMISVLTEKEKSENQTIKGQAKEDLKKFQRIWEVNGENASSEQGRIVENQRQQFSTVIFFPVFFAFIF